MNTAKSLLVFAAVTLAYVVGGKLGLALAYPHPSASAIWPPTGIAIAAVLVLGYRVWPAILLGAWIVNTTSSGAPITSAFIAAGNTLEALLAGYLVNRYAGGRHAFERPLTVFKFALLAAVVAPTVSALVGSVSLLVSGSASRSELGTVLLTWWLGDAAGALLVAPAIVLWSERPSLDVLRQRTIETALLIGTLILVALVVFAGFHPFPDKTLPLQIAAVPVLLWAAFRFSPRATATAILLLAGIAVWGTYRAVGPYGNQPLYEALLFLQLFMAVTAVTSLAVAAGVVQQQWAEEEVLRSVQYQVRLEERRQAEEALAQAQAIAHLGSWQWDVATGRLYWSDELCRIFGVEPNGFEATYEDWLQRLHPDDCERVEAIVQTAYQDLEPFEFYHRVVRPDGTVRTLYGRGAVIVDASGKPALMVGTGHDVTELKMAEEEHVRLAAAQAAIAARDDFLSMAAHELKTPLTSMYGYIQLLARQQHTGKLEAESLERGLELLESQSVKLTRLINDLLDVSRIESGKLELEPEACDLADLVGQAVGAAQARHPERAFVVRLPATAEVVVDPLRLEQVIANLLDNATKYSPSPEPIEIELAPSSPDGFEIAVQDHGVGVPVESREHIFDRYFQAHVNQHSPGLGLGLYISRQIVELHGGTLTAEFPAVGGSRFIIRLPAEAPIPVGAVPPD